MSARDRLAALDTLPARDLCAAAESALNALVEIMNAETVLLRTGHYRDAALLTADKTSLAQDYVSLARSVQREAPRLKREAPAALEKLRHGHEALATQMAENLRVIATARTVTETLLTDVAKVVGGQVRPKTYGASGTMQPAQDNGARGIAINRAL
jgi:hypothetical protein